MTDSDIRKINLLISFYFLHIIEYHIPYLEVDKLFHIAPFKKINDVL